MAVSRLARLASLVPAPVYLVEGAGARPATDELRGDSAVQVVDSPRHATVLLVAGAIPESFIPALARVHDQLSHPRATAWWTGPGPIDSPHLPVATRVDPDADVADRLVTIHRELMTGERASEADLLPDEPPNEWRGVGPNGQGGEGMMGGVPYGRPMAMTADDRDGLALDPLSFVLGPFLPFMPPGLQLQVTMQGDVLTAVEVGPNPFDEGDWLGSRITRGQTDAQLPSVDFARDRLRYVARVLGIHGLRALALRAYRLAADLTPQSGAEIRGLSRRLRRTTALRWSTEAVGTIDSTALPPGLGALQGDAWDRWRRALDDAGRAVALAAQHPTARDEMTGNATLWAEQPTGSQPWPRGDHPALELLPELLEGMELGAAVTTLVSLDLTRGLPRPSTVTAQA